MELGPDAAHRRRVRQYLAGLTALAKTSAQSNSVLAGTGSRIISRQSGCLKNKSPSG